MNFSPFPYQTCKQERKQRQFSNTMNINSRKCGNCKLKNVSTDENKLKKITFRKHKKKLQQRNWVISKTFSVFERNHKVLMECSKKEKKIKMRKQSSSFNTNRVLPVNCLNFHSIELRAGELSIWCQHLLYLRHFDSGERGDARQVGERERIIRKCLVNRSKIAFASRKGRVLGAFTVGEQQFAVLASLDLWLFYKSFH